MGRHTWSLTQTLFKMPTYSSSLMKWKVARSVPFDFGRSIGSKWDVIEAKEGKDMKSTILSCKIVLSFLVLATNLAIADPQSPHYLLWVIGDGVSPPMVNARLVLMNNAAQILATLNHA